MKENLGAGVGVLEVVRPVEMLREKLAFLGGEKNPSMKLFSTSNSYWRRKLTFSTDAAYLVLTSFYV